MLYVPPKVRVMAEDDAPSPIPIADGQALADELRAGFRQYVGRQITPELREEIRQSLEKRVRSVVREAFKRRWMTAIDNAWNAAQRAEMAWAYHDGDGQKPEMLARLAEIRHAKELLADPKTLEQGFVFEARQPAGNPTRLNVRFAPIEQAAAQLIAAAESFVADLERDP